MSQVEKFTRKVKGQYNDIIYYKNGEVKDLGWKENIIVDNFNILMALLLKNQAGIDGVTYWVIGEGLASWDIDGTPTPFLDENGCISEIFRTPVATEDIVFIDGNGEITATPSNIIQISVIVDYEEAIGDWREFSIMGGDATGTVDSGYSINKRNHQKLEKTIEMQIERRLRLILE